MELLEDEDGGVLGEEVEVDAGGGEAADAALGAAAVVGLEDRGEQPLRQVRLQVEPRRRADLGEERLADARLAVDVGDRRLAEAEPLVALLQRLRALPANEHVALQVLEVLAGDPSPVVVAVELAVLGPELVGERLEGELLPEQGRTDSEHVEEVATMLSDVAATLVVARLRAATIRDREPDRSRPGAEPLRLHMRIARAPAEREAEPAAHEPRLVLGRAMADCELADVEGKVCADDQRPPLAGVAEEHLVHELVAGEPR